MLMKTHCAVIAELFQVNDERIIRLKSKSLQPGKPGQFFQAFASDADELLPVLLYPCSLENEFLLCCGVMPSNWLPGSELHLRGPRGNGFHLPPLARRVALTTLDGIGVNRLLPLADQALENGAEVTLFSDGNPASLAAEIEVLPLQELNQIKGWADYFGAVLQPEKIAEQIKLLELIPGKAMSFLAEIMLDTPMICEESSVCGICSTLTNKGWKLACKDGPVFNLEDLVPMESCHASA